MSDKLMRSQTDKMVGGVCGGMGAYLGIDPTLVRIFFVLLGLSNSGIALLLYFVLWIVMPLEGEPAPANISEAISNGTQEMAERARTFGKDIRNTQEQRQRQFAIIGGIVLVVVGAGLLVQNLAIPWLTWFRFDLLWPILLIIGGLVLLVRQMRGETHAA
jgi:phage shock protein PspC (stress-responsive transcriptional regulator)